MALVPSTSTRYNVSCNISIAPVRRWLCMGGQGALQHRREVPPSVVLCVASAINANVASVACLPSIERPLWIGIAHRCVEMAIQLVSRSAEGVAYGASTVDVPANGSCGGCSAMQCCSR